MTDHELATWVAKNMVPDTGDGMRQARQDGIAQRVLAVIARVRAEERGVAAA